MLVSIKKLKNNTPSVTMNLEELAQQYDPSQKMLWLDESKMDHLENYREDEDTPCATAETLLARGLNIKTMTREEEYDLFSQYLEETDPFKKAMLRDEFLSRNLRLVLHIAKEKAKSCGCEPKELMAWGTMGMIRAFEKFSLDKGAKFSTYAALWIKQAMTRGLAETERAIRVPYNIITDQNKMRQYCQEFQKDYGFEAEDVDICAHFGWDQKKLDYIRQGLAGISSIDLPAAADGEDTIADLLEDDSSASVEDTVIESVKHDAIVKVLSDTLDERARDIVMNLFDFNGRRSLDKDELAQKYGITRERVLQIRDESIAMLRHPSKSRKLRSFAV